MATIYIPSLNVTLVNGEEAQPLTGDAAGQAWASLLKGDDIKTWSDVGIPGRTWQNDIPYHAVAKAVFSRQKMESATETEDTFCGSSSEGGGGKKVAFHGMISLSDGAAQVTAPDWPVCEASVGTAPALSDEITVTYNLKETVICTRMALSFMVLSLRYSNCLQLKSYIGQLTNTYHMASVVTK